MIPALRSVLADTVVGDSDENHLYMNFYDCSYEHMSRLRTPNNLPDPEVPGAGYHGGPGDCAGAVLGH